MLVSFPGDGLSLRGHLYRPPGDGVYRAIVWNHGSEPHPDAATQLAEFFLASGYVFFAPHRRGHGDSPGAYPLMAIQESVGREARDGADLRPRVIEQVIGMHERHLSDLAQALRWLGDQPFVDDADIVISGVSHGAIQTLLAAEADLGAVAHVPFAPGAMAWSENPELRERLLRAVRRARAPIFLVQAENDYDLGPSRVLGRELRRKGEPNAVRVFPAYGTTAQAGHGAFACHGMDVWGAEVQGFLDRLSR